MPLLDIFTVKRKNRASAIAAKIVNGEKKILYCNLSKDEKAKSLGARGEELACETLTGRGYSILHRNWRWQHLEVDIICTRNAVLHFVEVKSQTGTGFALPEFRVKGKKLSHLKRAASEYLFRHPEHTKIQFDIISIVFDNSGNLIDLFIIEDAA